MLDTGSATLYYEDDGPRDAPALVFSHSLFFDSRMFEAQAEAFSDRYRVIRYDHRGQGQSPHAPREQLDMDTLTEDAAALIEQLELAPCVFFGNSMGGFVALRLAARRPDLLSGVVVAGTSAAPEARVEEFDQVVDGIAAGGIAPVLDIVTHIMLGDTTQNDPERAELLQQTRERMSALDKDVADAAWQVVHREGILDELPTITVPVAVLAGAEDHAYEVPLSEQIHELTPNSTLTIVDRVGHSVALEDPETTNRHITELIERAAVAQT